MQISPDPPRKCAGYHLHDLVQPALLVVRASRADLLKRYGPPGGGKEEDEESDEKKDEEEEEEEEEKSKTARQKELSLDTYSCPE